jgi:hypothetical protein
VTSFDRMGVVMSKHSYRPGTTGSLFVLVCGIAAATMLLSPRAHAQEIPEFGSGAASTIEVNAPTRGKPAEVAPLLDLGVVRGLAHEPILWTLTPAVTQADEVGVIGLDLTAKRNRPGNKFRLLSLAYSNIDPDGTVGPIDQARLRYRDKLLSSTKGWGIEAMAQVTRRWDSFVEPVVQLNVGFKPSDWWSFSTNLGHVWRDRDENSTLKDFDAKFAVKRTLNLKNAFKMSADYRFKNDVTGEDDFSVGFELRDMWYLSVGKHWVASLSYVRALNKAR